MPGNVTVARSGIVTEITLNRPDKANALSSDLVETLLEAAEDAHRDGTRLLVLRGNGKHFCAGFDLAGLEECSGGDLAVRLIRIETLLQMLFHAPFATLALVHGGVFGAGADIMVACDARVAHPGTNVRFPGLMFDLVLGVRRLANRIGEESARRLLTAGKAVSAEDALGMGLLTMVESSEKWSAIVDDMAANIARLSPGATAAMRRRTVQDTRAEDMAELACSTAAPSFRDRVIAYRQQPKSSAASEHSPSGTVHHILNRD
jgi:enoyl-CoA hydratase/carnithine racemase